MRIAIGARSDVGRVRNANEDAFLVDEPLFAVADGMGGHIAGDVASATAVEVISHEADQPTAEELERYVKEANRAIWQKAHDDPQLHGMGTTCTLLFVQNGVGHLAHVGDSRAYLLRDEMIDMLTDDHTLVARFVEEGRLTPEEAHNHPQRSIITRALGVDDDVEVDLTEVDLEPGDRILLCSDGLSSMLEDRAIEHILLEEKDPQTAADALVEAANDAGGEDNVTVVVLDILEAQPEDGSPPTRAAGAAPADPPPRREPQPDPQDDEPSARRSSLRTLLIFLVVVAVIAGGAFAAARYTLANAWFVGANEDGIVSIYRGLPEDVAGLSLREEYQRGNVRLDDLPDFLRDDVERGLKVDSLTGARRAMLNLEDRSRDFQRRDQEEARGDS